jgi:hypothetical protein
MITFLALNPAWWSDPLGMPERVLTARSRLLDGQVEYARQTGDDVYNRVGDRITGLVNEAFFAEPQYYEAPVWKDYIDGQIAAYESSEWVGRRWAIWGDLLIGLVILGIGVLVNRIRRGVLHMRVEQALPLRKMDGPALVILILFGVVALSLLIATPFEWQRYYLLLHLPVAVIAGSGLSWITQQG